MTRARDLVRHDAPAFLTGCACLGIASANAVRLPVAACAVVATLAAAWASLPGRDRRLAGAACVLLALGCAWGALRLEALQRSELQRWLGRAASARAVVTSPPRASRFSVRVFATVTRYGRARMREPVLLALPPERAPPQGSVLEIRRAWPVEPRGPETGFDERAWLARRGIQVVLNASGIHVVGRRGGIGGVADRLRAHVERTIGLGADGERRALLAGVVLGADERVDRGLRDAFRDSGLLHLMAVSGQNVAIIGMGVVALAWLLLVPLLWAHAAAAAVVLAYALAVGWQPSVVRATVAGVLVSLAWVASRPRDRWYALSLGALLLLAWLPASVLEPGFQLSFAAVAAIFLIVPRIAAWLQGYPLPGGIAAGAALAIGCSLATAPIVLAQFGSAPVWAVPANVAAEGAMPPLLGLALAAAAVEPVSEPAAAALVWVAGWCASWLAFCARFFAGLPVATVGRVPGLLALASCLALVLVWRRLPRHRRRTLAVAALSAAIVAACGLLAFRDGEAWTPPAGLRVTFLDVGQGDSVLVEAPGAAVLVDQGPPEAGVGRQLWRLGVRALSLVVLTHPQRDHIGGAADVLRRLPVGSVLDPRLAAASPSPDYDAASAAIAARGTPVLQARAGRSYRLGALRLRVLWPDGPGHPGEDPNRRAVVLLASYGGTDVLLTADAESDVTGRLPLRSVEVLKVAHHGSEDAGLARQLRVLRPRVAVISVGRGNDYGHPRVETLAALAAVRGLRLYRTDLDGRVVVESDGRTITVRAGGRVVSLR